ncbi:hypothetical protein SRHO_G00080500 [Serrasalmus rhombeus]
MSKNRRLFSTGKKKNLGNSLRCSWTTRQLKQTKQAVFNHVFYCRGDKTGNLISTTKLARTNPTGETGPGETSSLLEKLVSTGVECKSDLKLIKDEDLQELLRPIQCHKLLQAWSTEEEITRVTDLQSETSGSSPVDIFQKVHLLEIPPLPPARQVQPAQTAGPSQ